MMNLKSMKTMIAGTALVGVCSGAAVLVTTDASANDKKNHQESAAQAQKRLSKQREMSGTVLDTKTVKFRGTDQANIVALVQTKKSARRLAVDLGPKQQLGSLKIKKGQELAARGVIINVGDRPVFVADKLKQGDKTVDIDRMGQLKALKAAQSKAATKGAGAPNPGSGTNQKGSR